MAVLMWLSVWMLAVPLFHVHPEADHHHGEAGHVHGGTVHTVLSGDLDCEFDSHEKAAQASGGLSAHRSHAWQEHPEFVFSLLSDSNNPKYSKPLLTQVPFMPVAVVPAPQGRDSAAQEIASFPSSTFFAHDHPLRAPPSLLV